MRNVYRAPGSGGRSSDRCEQNRIDARGCDGGTPRYSVRAPTYVAQGITARANCPQPPQTLRPPGTLTKCAPCALVLGRVRRFGDVATARRCESGSAYRRLPGAIQFRILNERRRRPELPARAKEATRTDKTATETPREPRPGRLQGVVAQNRHAMRPAYLAYPQGFYTEPLVSACGYRCGVRAYFDVSHLLSDCRPRDSPVPRGASHASLILEAFAPPYTFPRIPPSIDIRIKGAHRPGVLRTAYGARYSLRSRFASPISRRRCDAGVSRGVAVRNAGIGAREL